MFVENVSLGMTWSENKVREDLNYDARKVLQEG